MSGTPAAGYLTMPAFCHGNTDMDASGDSALQRTSLPLALAAVAAVFLWLNLQVPRFADDFCSYAPAFSLPEILHDVGSTYLTWTGRFPVMFLVHTLFSLGAWGLLAFDVVNALCLAAAGWFGVRCALAPGTTAHPARLPALAICLFLTWFTPAGFGEIALWKSGAVQYLWGCLVALMAILMITERIVWQHRPAISPGRTAAFCLVCFFGGAWLENLSVAVLITWLMLIIADFYRRHHIDRFSAFGLLAWAAGFVTLIIAPGNYARAGKIGYSASLLDRLATTAGHLIDYLDKRLTLAFMLFCVLLLLTEHPNVRRKLASSLSFASVGVFSILAMTGAPEITFLQRAAFPFQFMLVMATLCLFPDHLFTPHGHRALRRLVSGISALLAVALTANFATMLGVYTGVHRETATRERIIARADRQTPIQLPPLTLGERYSTANGSINFGRYFARDITDNARNWRNICYAKAYHVDSVVLARQDGRGR